MCRVGLSRTGVSEPCFTHQHYNTVVIHGHSFYTLCKVDVCTAEGRIGTNHMRLFGGLGHSVASFTVIPDNKARMRYDSRHGDATKQLCTVDGFPECFSACLGSVSDFTWFFTVIIASVLL